MSDNPVPICDHPYDAIYRRAIGSLVCGECGTALKDVKRTLGDDDRRPGIPVEVRQAPINTANYQITAAMVYRFNTKAKGWFDPCLICGVIFNNCPHKREQTEIVWNQIKAMSKAERDRILKK